MFNSYVKLPENVWDTPTGRFFTDITFGFAKICPFLKLRLFEQIWKPSNGPKVYFITMSQLLSTIPVENKCRRLWPARQSQLAGWIDQTLQATTWRWSVAACPDFLYYRLLMIFTAHDSTWLLYMMVDVFDDYRYIVMIHYCIYIIIYIYTHYMSGKNRYV